VTRSTKPASTSCADGSGCGFMAIVTFIDSVAARAHPKAYRSDSPDILPRGFLISNVV
jgi:hypothetical protein